MYTPGHPRNCGENRAREAEVAQAKLAGYGIESVVVDPIEGGAIPIEVEGGLALQVPAQDARDAATILPE